MRRAKTEAKLSQRAAVARLRVGAPDAALAAVESAAADLRDALTIDELDGRRGAGADRRCGARAPSEA